MERVRSLSNQRESVECLDTLEERLFIELFLCEKVQVEREPMAELERQPGSTGEVEAVQQVCVPKGAQ